MLKIIYTCLDNLNHFIDKIIHFFIRALRLNSKDTIPYLRGDKQLTIIIYTLHSRCYTAWYFNEYALFFQFYNFMNAKLPFAHQMITTNSINILQKPCSSDYFLNYANLWINNSLVKTTLLSGSVLFFFYSFSNKVSDLEYFYTTRRVAAIAKRKKSAMRAMGNILGFWFER